MSQKSLLNKFHFAEHLKECISSKHFFCVDNQVFKGEGNLGTETMIKFVSMQLGIPCMQIEINSSLVVEDGNPFLLHQKSKLLHCFCEFLKSIKV